MRSGYEGDLDRMLAKAEPPPCRACDGLGLISWITIDGLEHETECHFCEGKGFIQDDGEGRHADEQP